jgi:DMSO/TMAO reductase YedYZ heme-binding membrane subunit
VKPVLLAPAALVVAVPLVLALTDGHLAGEPVSLVVSAITASLALSALALQPVLAAIRVPWHRVVGVVALVLVLGHVGALFVLSPDDAWFAMSPDGPTRARMAAIALVALLAVAVLGLGRGRLPLSRSAWRVLHAYFATVAIVLGFGHALLTDGALDGVGTAVIWALGVLGVLAIPAAHAARTGRR